MNESERKKRYRQHRLRIQNAKSLVDSQAPKPTNRREQRELSFLEMMSALSQNGKRRTFTQSPVRYTSELKMQLSPKDWPLNRNLLTTRPVDQKNKKECQFPKNHQKNLSYVVPHHVWQRYQSMPFIKSPRILGKLLRPEIFLDLLVGHSRPLGRLVVQLFTESCPEIVSQFVRICLAQRNECFRFVRIFPHLWLEGELQLLDNKALTIPNIEHDPRAINHGSSAGILSFPSRYLRGSKFRRISFSISYKPIEVFNGKRIAIGKIRRGQHVLDRMTNFPVHSNGKPVKEIMVTSCGLV